MTSALSAELVASRITELQAKAGTSGVPKRELFALAKEAIALGPDAIEDLLEPSDHDTRVVAVSIMDFQARLAKLDPECRRELFELYLRRHDRIDTWGLVDRAAPYVVGGYLYDQPRDPCISSRARSTGWLGSRGGKA